jgi:hypothetical protein
MDYAHLYRTYPVCDDSDICVILSSAVPEIRLPQHTGRRTRHNCGCTVCTMRQDRLQRRHDQSGIKTAVESIRISKGTRPRLNSTSLQPFCRIAKAVQGPGRYHSALHGNLTSADAAPQQSPRDLRMSSSRSASTP